MAGRTRNVFSAVTRFFDEVGRARDLAHTYERLSMLSDADLARRGLKRSELVQVAARHCGF